MLQNAVRVIETGEIIASKSSHDYVEVTTPSGKTAMVDGGPDYLRRGGDAEVEELSFDDNATVLEQFDKQLWGTFGPNGDQPLKYILLRDAEVDHLQKILQNGQSLTKRLKSLIQLILQLKTTTHLIVP